VRWGGGGGGGGGGGITHLFFRKEGLPKKHNMALVGQQHYV